MKFHRVIKKRNTKNNFSYLRHPTFIIKVLLKKKFYFKCFSCKKLYPTKYRLSRHLIYSKCLSNNPRIDHTKIQKYKEAKKISNLNIHNSDLANYNEKFLQKKFEMYTLFQGPYFSGKNTANYNNKDYVNNFKNDCNQILIKILNIKDNLLGGGRFCNVFFGENLNTNTFLAIKIPKSEAKSISKEINSVFGKFK